MGCGKDDVVVFGIQFPRLNGIKPFLAFEPPAVRAMAIRAQPLLRTKAISFLPVHPC
jgi:hypothetical protein